MKKIVIFILMATTSLISGPKANYNSLMRRIGFKTFPDYEKVQDGGTIGKIEKNEVNAIIAIIEEHGAKILTSALTAMFLGVVDGTLKIDNTLKIIGLEELNGNLKDQNSELATTLLDKDNIITEQNTLRAKNEKEKNELEQSILLVQEIQKKLEGERDGLKNERDGLKEKQERLTKELKDKGDELGKKAGDIRILTNEKTTLQTNIRTLETEKQELEKSLQKSIESGKQVDGLLQKSIESGKQVEERLQQSTLSEKEAQERITQLEDQIAILTTALEGHEALQQQLEGLQTEMNALKAANVLLTQGNEGLLGENEKWLRDNKTLVTQTENLLTQNGELFAQTETLVGEKDGLLDQNNSLVLRREALEGANNDLLAALDELQNKVSSAQNDLAAMALVFEAALTLSNKKIEELEGESGNLNGENQKLEGENQKLEGENEELSKWNQSLTEQLELQIDKNALLAQSNNDFNDRIETLQNSIRELAIRQYQYAALILTFALNYARVQHENLQLRESVKESLRVIDEQQGTIDDLEKNISSLEKTLAKSEKKRERLLQRPQVVVYNGPGGTIVMPSQETREEVTPPTVQEQEHTSCNIPFGQEQKPTGWRGWLTRGFEKVKEVGRSIGESGLEVYRSTNEFLNERPFIKVITGSAIGGSIGSGLVVVTPKIVSAFEKMTTKEAPPSAFWKWIERAIMEYQKLPYGEKIFWNQP